MKKTTQYLFLTLLCSLATLVGCQTAEESGHNAASLSDTATTAAQCQLAGQALDSMKSDVLFQQPYVDVDEWRNQPTRHRYIHGGFSGTDTRFSLYLPPKKQYGGRFFQYVTPVPINEYVSQGASGEEDKIGFSLSNGAYFVETNGGGLKAMMRDPTIAAYRANAAVAQYGRTLAMAMYGCDRPYGYIFGGSGGGFRSMGSMENTSDVWDGAVPYVIGSPMAMPNGFTVRMYALRVLEDKLPLIADAMDAGSDIDLRKHLNDEEYAAFEEVSKMGFPKQAWYIHDRLDLHGFASLFPGLIAADPSYFDNDFWNLPGYEGHTPPRSLRDAMVDHQTSIKNLIFAHNAEQSGLKESLTADESEGLADDAWRSLVQDSSADAPLAIQLQDAPKKDLMGAYLTVKTGAAKGHRFLITRHSDNFILLGGRDHTPLETLAAGDEVIINNRDFLASQTYHRHQVPAEGYPVYDQYRNEQGKPDYPQRPFLLAPQIAKTAAGSIPSGDFEGKMIVLSNLHDTEAYPWQGDWYWQAAHSHFGGNIDNKLRLWYTDRTAHGDHSQVAMPAHMVSYLGVLQQALLDLSVWVEQGIEPAATSHYTIEDGQVELPHSARERQGIQPVVHLSVNGGERAEVAVGESVELKANIDVPEGAGKLVYAAWDFEDRGTFAQTVSDDHLGQSSAALTTTHEYDRPGTYFVTLKVASQRDGDFQTPYTRIRNLARVRVVVR